MRPCSIASGKINHSRKWHNCLSGGRRRYASEPRSLLEKPNGFFRTEIGDVRVMPNAPTLMAFVLAVLAMQLVPGPETMLVLSRGIGEDRRVAL